MTDFIPGNSYSGFVLQRMEIIDEINSTVLQFTHELLGTPVLAIKNTDPNKTFCIAFNTLPEDSTGVAHILEHSVLMGSKKYPVKDVFGEINKGGLMTFLNAMTGADTTYYPFATLNQTEYFNIMDVYCDVTFNPLLEKTTFEQEGWHYHKENSQYPLEFQGVVFNEMKGAFSDPIRTIFHHTYSGLMPGSTYAHESGGDPKNIPDLDYDQFSAFHQKYYHPSNATFFFYGDADLNLELSFLQDRFLRHFSTPGSVGQIIHGQLISQPVSIEDTYSVQAGAELSGKTYLAVASAVSSVLNRKENIAFQIISQILYNSDASPLKKAIVDAAVCSDFGGLYLASSSFKTVMLTYLIGSEVSHRDTFTSTYRSTLNDLVTKGLEHDLVLSELNKFEFSFRESMTKAQRGLDLISNALVALKYGADPFSFLCFENIFKEIRQQSLEENYFEELIKQSLLDNPSTVEILLTPDPVKSTQLLEEENQRLASFEEHLDEQGQQTIIDRTTELIKLQNTPNNEETLRLLPHLNPGDLDTAPDFHEVEATTILNRPFLISNLPTNSICYIDFGFDVSVVNVEMLPFLSLFGSIVTEIGTDTKDYMHLAKELGTLTGGLDSNFSTYTNDRTDASQCSPILWFQLKALRSYLEPALELISEILLRTSFHDRKRIKEIVLREFAWTEHSVHSEGYSLASSRVFSHLSTAGKYNEYVSGATAFLTLKELASNYDQYESRFIATLEKLKTLLLHRNGLTLSITAEHEGIQSFQKLVTPLITSLPEQPVTETDPLVFPSLPHSQGLCTPSEVVYNVQGCNLFTDPSHYNGHFEVLKSWISRDYLWNSVRQIGGAYGCFIQFNFVTGNIGFISYRDPHIAKTFAAYDDLPKQINQLQLSQQVLDQLVIGTYGSLTPHQSPAVKGISARNDYLSGITKEFKHQRIDQVLNTTLESLQSFAPFFDTMKEASFRATIGNGDKIRGASDLFTDILDL